SSSDTTTGPPVMTLSTVGPTVRPVIISRSSITVHAPAPARGRAAMPPNRAAPRVTGRVPFGPSRGSGRLDEHLGRRLAPHRRVELLLLGHVQSEEGVEAIEGPSQVGAVFRRRAFRT